MRSVNKVILIGNLGADPEARYMPSGSLVASISIATNIAFRDKQTGLLEKRAEWHKVSLSEQLWVEAKDHLKKGSKVYIEGSIRTRKWQNQQGINCYITEIIANKLLILDLEDGKGANNNISENTAIKLPANNQVEVDDLPF